MHDECQSSASRRQVVVTDLAMPGLDGFELCRKVRAFRSPAETAIITRAKMLGDRSILLQEWSADLQRQLRAWRRS